MFGNSNLASILGLKSAPPVAGIATGGGGENPTTPTPARRLAPSEMQQWNQFLDFVKSKGKQGSVELNAKDKGLGAKLFQEFKAATPGVTIGYDIVPSVQNEFMQLQRTAQDFAKRKGDANASKVFSGISKPDGWFGSKTSQQYFPAMIDQTVHNGQLQKVENLGLVDGKLQPTGTTAAAAAMLRKKKAPQYGDAGAIENADGTMSWE
jgi:hypothetical protein